MIVIAAQEDGPGIGRIRMRRIVDASAESLMPFVKEAIEPGSTVHADGWLGYLRHRSLVGTRSANRGKLFYRLAQQAVAIDPAPNKSLVRCALAAETATKGKRNL